jgi:hypothetical protein
MGHSFQAKPSRSHVSRKESHTLSNRQCSLLQRKKHGPIEVLRAKLTSKEADKLKGGKGISETLEKGYI